MTTLPTMNVYIRTLLRIYARQAAAAARRKASKAP